MSHRISPGSLHDPELELTINLVGSPVVSTGQGTSPSLRVLKQIKRWRGGSLRVPSLPPMTVRKPLLLWTCTHMPSCCEFTVAPPPQSAQTITFCSPSPHTLTLLFSPSSPPQYPLSLRGEMGMFCLGPLPHLSFTPNITWSHVSVSLH